MPKVDLGVKRQEQGIAQRFICNRPIDKTFRKNYILSCRNCKASLNFLVKLFIGRLDAGEQIEVAQRGFSI